LKNEKPLFPGYQKRTYKAIAFLGVERFPAYSASQGVRNWGVYPSKWFGPIGAAEFALRALDGLPESGGGPKAHAAWIGFAP